MACAQVRDVPRTTKAPARAPRPSPLPGPAGDPPQHPRTPSVFRAVLGHRYCGRLLIGSVSGRLSLGMVPVALILAAQADGHFLACAGVLAALYGIAPALGLPLLGRLADLRGLLLPCCLGAALVAVALGTLAVAGTAYLLLAVGCAVLAGAGCPPLEGGLRSLWHAVLPDDAHVRTAYTLDSSTQSRAVHRRSPPPRQASWAMDVSSPGIARHNKKTPRCEHHDVLLQPEQRTGFATRFPAGHRAQVAFLLAGCAGNASLVAALLGTGVRTVRRHCRGWRTRPGSGCAGPCAAVSWTSCARRVCPVVRWNRRAGRIGKPGARPDGFRMFQAAWIHDIPRARESSAPAER